MTLDRTLGLTAIGAIGAALVAFPFLPGAWPNPLPQGSAMAAPALSHLKAAAARVDEACASGDVASFESVVTTAHRQRLSRQLRALQQPLDGEALLRFSSQRQHSFAAILDMPVLASEVRGPRAALAVRRPGGDGAQVLEFVWDGRQLRLHDSRHATMATIDKGVRALVVDAVAAGSR